MIRGVPSPEKTKYGTWRARWRDPDGTQRAKSFKRKVDAERFLAATLTDLDRGVFASAQDTKLTVEQAADDWLAGAMNLGQGGQDTYRRDLDRYIIPALGHYRLTRLTPDIIDRFLADELERLAPSTVHRHYRTLRRLCQVAVDRGKLARNPCEPVTPPRVEQTEMRFLTAEEVEALAAAISPRYRAWVHTAAYAGPRWSEAVGLRRGNVQGDRLAIVEQLIRRADGEWHRDAPKTRAGRRVVTLPKFLAVELEEHLTEFALPGADGLVFPNAAGNPPTGPSFTGNVFKPALKRAGLDMGIRIHDLRHTAVALAIKVGAHPKAIQARMGHASISVTLDRYGHLFPEMDEQVAAGLDALRPPV